MKTLVLGAYGLIGSHVVRRLSQSGGQITGLGRSVQAAARQSPRIEWIEADLRSLMTPADWDPILASVHPDAIVNCAGALQNGLWDDLAATQSGSIVALIAAAEDAGVKAFVQISAPRSSILADTEFMRTKGEADAALEKSRLAWTILRPGLVLAPQAYGGTALLRALAATPCVLPVAFANAPVQCVFADEVAEAVELTLAGKTTSRQVYDLVEDGTHTLGEVLTAMRAWLGLPPAKTVHVPEWLVRASARCADALGWLGWRPPLRTTAIRELSAGVEGDPQAWRQESGKAMKPLDAILASMPSTLQDRWFARLFFLKPAIIATLGGFWLLTGAIALMRYGAATRVLTSHGVDADLAELITFGGAVVDIVLGAAILVRRWMPAAALGMAAVTLVYLAGGTIFLPALWADPLGPLLKALPALLLALAALAMTSER